MTRATRQILQIGAVLTGIYAFCCVIARIESADLIFPDFPATYTELPGLIRIRGKDGQEFAAVHWPNPSARHLLVFFHGNFEDLGVEQRRFRQLRDEGFAVLAVDYPGYGLSFGRKTEAGFYESADATFRYATEELGWAKERIIVHGLSLGGAAAVWVASREHVGGLILESSFMSAYRVMTSWPVLLGDRMPNLSRMKTVRCPVLVIHGTDDRVIGAEHGRALFAAAPEPKRAYWVPGAGHNNVLATAGPRYGRELKAFEDALPR